MRAIYLVYLFMGLSVFCCAASGSREGSRELVRPPAVAGQFYPADPVRLRLALQWFFQDALRTSVSPPVALVVPHAGYIFSGQIAADAFQQAAGQAYDVVVILGTNHTAAGFRKISVYPRGGFRTPLGIASVDETVAGALLAEDSDCSADPEPQEREHSIEVQVPFVQTVFPNAKIVPVVIGTPDAGMCTHFGQVLAKTLKNRRALIVASSDLSHYPSYEDACGVDRQTLEAVARMEVPVLASRIKTLMDSRVANLGTCACGEAPILAAVVAARAMGGTRGVVISYANSGDVAIGDRSRVVGYGSVVMTTGKEPSDTSALKPPSASASAEAPSAIDKKALLTLARETLHRYLAAETVPLPRGLSSRLQGIQGAFVTLRKRGQLRGCVGRMTSDSPLGLTVSAVALESALSDTRFKPVTESELPDLEIEISVLTPMKPVAGAQDIRLGRDGVLLRKAGRSAVFLPQVATEQNWGVSELLENLCRKAGLPEGCWQKDAQLSVFQADVFSESELK